MGYEVSVQALYEQLVLKTRFFDKFNTIDLNDLMEDDHLFLQDCGSSKQFFELYFEVEDNCIHDLVNKRGFDKLVSRHLGEFVLCYDHQENDCSFYHAAYVTGIDINNKEFILISSYTGE